MTILGHIFAMLLIFSLEVTGIIFTMAVVSHKLEGIIHGIMMITGISCVAFGIYFALNYADLAMAFSQTTL